jgi:hypothetical protein
VRPKGGRAAAAEPTEVSRLLNAVRDSCRKPNGSMRPKGGSGAVVEATGQGALGDPCRMPNGSVRPKGGRAAAAEPTEVSRLLNAVRDPLQLLAASWRGNIIEERLITISTTAAVSFFHPPAWKYPVARAV